MKRYILLTLILLTFISLSAQSIAVKSFRPLPMDMTASSLEGKRVDQNGQLAALIKIVTSETGFTFEGGALGIVDTKQRNGEIWVWVPRASRKITILHQQLGVLRDYRYPIEIEAERTYEMVLTTGTVETIIKEEVRQQYLIFELEPKNATLEVNDKLWSVDAEGTALQFVDFGTYTYRVRAANYISDAGLVTVDDPDNPKTVKVKLKPDFAEVTLKVDADAEIWVNNEKKGTRTWTGPLGKGTYKIECKQEGHETTMISKEITTEMNGQTITLPTPIPVYGSLNVESTPIGATIFIDGKEVGKTPKSINEILVGEHEVKLVKEGYDDYAETVHIRRGERGQIKDILNKRTDDGQKTIEGFLMDAPFSNNDLSDKTFTVNGVRFTMKFVEGGSFQMGATSEQGEIGAYDEWKEKPVHSVSLSDYYIGETEVTQALWEAVMGCNPSIWEGENRPVEQVSWNDCQEFILKLNQKTGKNFRLPTEAEWEYAARGGKKSCGYKYAGSNNISDVAWIKDNSDGITHNVKTKSPNELGLYDMCGNVCEWCSDWCSDNYYSESQSTNPSGPLTGSSRVLRGGCFRWMKESCRVSSRCCGYPTKRHRYDGFRLVLSL